MKILFSKRLKDLMKEKKVNQVQLANGTGLRQNMISAWLLDKKQAHIVSLWILADYFNVSIDYLVGRKDF